MTQNSPLNSKNDHFLPRKKFLKHIKGIIGYKPKDLVLFREALLHKSGSPLIEKGFRINNERLEFLGDSILDAVIAEHLFTQFPDRDEGFLTRMRSKIVNREKLNHLGMKLGINHVIVCRMSNDNPKSIYGDALEALIGAVYIDKGYKKAKKIIVNRIIKNHIDLNILQDKEIDFKSRVIEWGQKQRKEINFNCYEEVSEDEKTPVFMAHLYIGDDIFGRGIGSSKKEAEQNAARQALKNIED